MGLMSKLYIHLTTDLLIEMTTTSKVTMRVGRTLAPWRAVNEMGVVRFGANVIAVL